MAELLVYNRRGWHREIHPQGKGYDLGDVVTIMPDGWDWGSEERNPRKFVIIQLPGVAKERLQTLLAAGVLIGGLRRTAKLEKYTGVLNQVDVVNKLDGNRIKMRNL